MCLHVAKHLLKQTEIHSHTCGFCGQIGSCDIQLHRTKGKDNSNNPIMVPHSVNCRYFYKFSLGPAATGSASCPTTNRPAKCPKCDLTFWTYSFQTHYNNSHPREQCPFVVPEEERAALISSKLIS